MLVPEIALTPQLLAQFSAQFGDEIAILHSMLSAGERCDEWKRVRSGRAKVVVGTRSAIFAPLENLGLIVLDEEQESSYKSENTPRYHARDVAKCRGGPLWGASGTGLGHPVGGIHVPCPDGRLPPLQAAPAL